MGKLKYLYFAIAVILLAVIVMALPTVYNPFTGKLDYYGVNNFTCPSGYVVSGFDTNSSGVCIITPAGVETDPLFTANFTNMRLDCPAGNYTFGVNGNGTLKCRSDLTGAGIEVDPIFTAENVSLWNEAKNKYNLSYATWAYNQTTGTFNNYGRWWYNQTTGTFNIYGKWWYNMSDGSYNATYSIWSYNQTYSGSTFNATYNALNSTYGKFWYNHTSSVETLYGKWFYNQTYSGSTYNATYDALIKWGYNQTVPAVTDINNRFWNITQSWNRTQLYNISQIDGFSASWSSTYNATYSSWAYNQTNPAVNYVNANFYNKSANVNVVNYNVSVASNYRFCLDGATCAKYIYYNGSNVIIQG